MPRNLDGLAQVIGRRSPTHDLWKLSPLSLFIFFTTIAKGWVPRLLARHARTMPLHVMTRLHLAPTWFSVKHLVPQFPLAGLNVPPASIPTDNLIPGVGTPKDAMRRFTYRSTSVHAPLPHHDANRALAQRSMADMQQSVERCPAWLNNPSIQSDVFGDEIRDRRPYFAVKRAFDLGMAIALALVTLPLIPLIALAIKLDSSGPVFYSQDRVGQYGRIFTIYKFRSMCTDAERDGAVWAQQADPRVTRVGRFMRRSRIDELPQLWNVVRGDMTFVGPRPERPEFTGILEMAFPEYANRFSVKPGLTGWAQIRYRYASSVHDSAIKLEYDLHYVQHQSIFFDFKILFLTIPVVVNLRGK